MREILFRGKRKFDNTWIYGGYMKTIRTNKIQVGGTSRFCTIHSETLGQYTGLKDKNGTKIFEGDIVRIGSQIGYIVYNYGSFGIGLSEGIDYKKLEKKIVSWLGIENDNFLPLLEVYWNFNDEDEILAEVKIIGNRYDNPELLEVAE